MLLTKISPFSSLKFFQELPFSILHPFYFFLELLVFRLDDGGVGGSLGSLFIAGFSLFLLNVFEFSLELGVFCKQTGSDYFVFTVPFLLFIEKDLFQIFQFVLDVVVRLHQLLIVLLSLIFVLPHHLVLLLYLLKL